jgi:hypothetical protein
LVSGFFILAARSHDENWIKILFGVMAFLIWVGGAIVSAIKKKAEENRRVQRYGQMPSGVTPAPPMLPPPVPQRTPQTAGRAKSGRTMAKRVQAAAPPARTMAAAAATFNRTAAISAAPPATVAAQPRAASPSPAPANQIGRLLRRADSLRAALILNEVFSPPLSLREDRGIPDEPALH